MIVPAIRMYINLVYSAGRAKEVATMYQKVTVTREEESWGYEDLQRQFLEKMCKNVTRRAYR